MGVTIKLFADFRVDRFKENVRDYPDAATVRTVVSDMEIREGDIGIILINGRHGKIDQPLKEGDVLALFPLIGGG